MGPSDDPSGDAPISTPACPDRELLASFFVGTLDPANADVVGEHLFWCPACNCDA